VVWYAEPTGLWAKLRRADPALFALAVAVGIASNVVSAVRWAVIARGLGLSAPTAPLILMYARGITTNILLPGATLSGDLLRSVQLSRLGNPFMPAALSVFLDRFSGLWTLCVLSLLSAAGVLLSGGMDRLQLAWYMLGLAALSGAPFVPMRLQRLRCSRLALLSSFADAWERLQARLRQARPALIGSVWQSLAVQLLSAATLWVCAQAVGVSLSYAVMLAAAAPIFIMAAVPIGIAGFGTRELAAVMVLGVAGLPGDQATATALLYGFTTVMQGLLAAPLFLAKV
jgi:hypothetical protein